MKHGSKHPTDTSDQQWEILRKLLPPAKRRGRKPIDRRWILNAIFYSVRTVEGGDERGYDAAKKITDCK